jgi:hypothetical protein
MTAIWICVLVGLFVIGRGFLFLCSKPTIDGEEREECLVYITETVTNIAAFWDKESALFNNTLDKLDSISKSPLAASKVCNAANRAIQAAQEANHRHNAIQPIPKAALPMHYAYSTLFLRNKEWVESILAYYEAQANGMTPQYEILQHLTEKRESAWHEAYHEYGKLLNKLGLTKSEIEAISRNRHYKLEAAKEDSWHPEPTLVRGESK